MTPSFQATALQAAFHERKPVRLRLVKWLFENLLRDQDVKERQVLTRFSGRAWCDATEREIVEAFNGRDPFGRRF